MRVEPLHGAEDVRRIAPEVRRVAGKGGVLVIPTETFYGLAADPRSSAAVARVYALKDRPRGMPLPVLCAGWAQVEALVEIPDTHRARLSRCWPGPLTVVLPVREPLAAAPGRTLAVRIPGHDLLRSLLDLVGPLTGTSANRHGAPPSTEALAAARSLAGTPDLVLDGGPTPGGAPSTLVDLSGSGPRLLRAGPVAWT